MSQLISPEVLIATIENRDYDAFKALCEEAHAADIAELLLSLPDQDVDDALASVDIETCAEIFTYLDADKQLAISERTNDEKLLQLISYMDAADRVDILQVLPAERRQKLLHAFNPDERHAIEQLFAHPEGTAGAIMTSDYVSFSKRLSIKEAISKIRRQAIDKETVYYCYVINNQKQLIGFISLKDLILADPEATVESIMKQNVISANAEDSQEVAARMISKYDLIALPVVNNNGTLVGIITHDDAIEVLDQELTEDIQKFMAIGGDHTEGYFSTSTWGHFKNRSPWIVSLTLIGFISAYILHAYEDAIAAVILLMLYIPMVADTGGNTGSQSATLIVRSLALGDVTLKDTLKVLFKEFKVSIMLALILALIAFLKVILFATLFDAGESSTGIYSIELIAIVIAVSLGLQVITATLVGAFLPLAAQKLKLDPALVASPAITTIVDITGMLIFFTVATKTLGL